ncbi:cytochrome P450 family protein [Thermoactinospora rubra]|uniref:cytochrome P450 family protein n=1 Tax=Thermoactinospora rubra TaxID=1088767 RepID=UPI000A11B281|nr:cytochrome P450 [Thermoactinospora rubra]
MSVERLEWPGGLYGWLVKDYEEARNALNDARLSKDPRNAPPEWQAAGRGRPLEDRQGLGTHLLTMDPPEHTEVRAVLSPHFRPRALERLRPRIEQVASDLAGGLTGQVDLIGRFAAPLSMTVICELLGVTRRDTGRWADAVVAEGDREAALREFAAFIPDLVASKRREPGADLVSVLADGRLPEPHLVNSIFLLLIAGYETTVDLIGNGMLALLTHPGQLALLRDRPGLLPAAVEELLRYDGPVGRSTWRFAVEPVRIGGRLLEEGEPILVALHEANRGLDPALDVTRAHNPHLAFGYGRHYCLGAHLARLEATVAVRALIGKDLELAVPAHTLERRRSLTLRGLRALPVTVGRRPR